MLYIIDNCTDPYRNLAAEEYLFKGKSEPVFRLWRNDRAVIVGRNQNTAAEVNREYVRQNGIAVVRRLSGGGAVFHDLGNVNFTFIDNVKRDEDTSEMFRRYTKPIIDALGSLGIEAKLEGRNDLTIEGKKFSGNAIAISGGRILQHGTLLFSSSYGEMTGALKNRKEKYSDKAVKSIPARVTNISEHMKHSMKVEDFMEYLENRIAQGEGRYSYDAKDDAAIDLLCRKRYRTDEWNYGKSPNYNVSNVCKFPSGLYEAYYDVSQGKIGNLHIYGDYFFTLPTEEFCRHLEGCDANEESLKGGIAALPYGEYFKGMTIGELIRLLLP
ncbi:MAG: lipoate--protein ligase [Bacteroidales bacterium]|jgi:lipoate-protein ligase A|nr:lipoate--protein ligase [Bacteroidales bacterium]